VLPALYTAPMLIADTAAVIASVLAVVTLIPQIMKLWRTRNAEGVSATWASLGAVSNGAWTAYLWSQALWLATPSTTVMAIFYLVTLLLIGWTGRPILRATSIGILWAALLTAGGVIGGWPGLGLILGVSFGVQATPSIWTAFRTWSPRGISTGTWQLILIEGVLWSIYGAGHADRAVVVFGVLSAIASLLMLGRYYSTRHRWLDPSPSPSVRSSA
jgi:uncharacterized protein with PQ loop repeat